MFPKEYLAQEEREVRSWYCAQLKFPRCHGYLTVTNKRVIFHGVSGNEGALFGESRIMEEVKLSSVSGISTAYGSKISKLKVLILCCLILLCIGAASLISNPFFRTMNRGNSLSINYFALIATAILVIGALITLRKLRVKTFAFQIYSSQANGSPISIGQGFNGILGGSAALAVIGSPTSETDEMMLQIGALIDDLQTYGDHAFERWGEEIVPPSTTKWKMPKRRSSQNQYDKRRSSDYYFDYFDD